MKIYEYVNHLSPMSKNLEEIKIIDTNKKKVDKLESISKDELIDNLLKLELILNKQKMLCILGK